jgi:hypothetical protein
MSVNEALGLRWSYQSMGRWYGGVDVWMVQMWHWDGCGPGVGMALAPSVGCGGHGISRGERKKKE